MVSLPQRLLEFSEVFAGKIEEGGKSLSLLLQFRADEILYVGVFTGKVHTSDT